LLERDRVENRAGAAAVPTTAHAAIPCDARGTSAIKAERPSARGARVSCSCPEKGRREIGRILKVQPPRLERIVRHGNDCKSNSATSARAAMRKRRVAAEQHEEKSPPKIHHERREQTAASARSRRN